MRDRLTGVLLGAAVLFGAVDGFPATAAEEAPRAELGRRIRAAVKELHELRAQRREVAERHQERLEKLRQQRDRAEKDARRVKQKVKELEAAKAELEKTLRKRRATRAALRKRLENAMGAARPVAGALERFLQRGVVKGRESGLEQLAQVQKRFAEDKVGARAQGVAALLDWAGRTLASTRAIAQFHAPVHLDGGKRRVHANRLRIGRVAELFVSEDGRRVGMARRGKKADWRLAEEAEPAARIRAALRIRQRQAPARLIGVPLPLQRVATQRPATAPSPSKEGSSS